MARSQVTLLQREMTRRRLTREETIRVLERRASDIEVHDFALSLRQLDRWLAGEVSTLPRPSTSRVMEAEFGTSVERLLAAAAPTDPPAVALAPVVESPDVNTMVTESALSSARFGQWADSLAIGDLVFATLWLRLGQLAVDYVHAPMVPVFRQLAEIRDDVFALLKTPDPLQAQELYLLAGTACGLLAHASGNLGHLGSAQVQACAALVCARKAQNPTLGAWALGVRALQSEWSGNASDGLRFIAQARDEIGDERVRSTVPVWLAAIEARAYSRLGNRHRTLASLAEAARAREEAAEATEPNALDRIGGILTFVEAKQSYYAGTAYRRIGDFKTATERSMAALAAYAMGPTEQRSYGDEIIAWADVALARACGNSVDLDGCAAALREIEEQPPERWMPALVGPLNELSGALSRVAVRDAPQAVTMRNSIAAMISSSRRSVAEVKA